MKTTLRNTWISGASLAAVLLVSGLTPVEARAIADDHTAAHAEQSRDAGEVVNDSWITTKVKSQLLADGDVSGFDISVETRDNVVHLSGEVESQAQVDHAVSIARGTEGVARVDASELRFDTAVGQVRDAVAGNERNARVEHDAHNEHNDQDRSAGEVIDDSWITTKVKSQLLADSDVSGFDISVETRDNVVHLSGEVESQAQIDHAVSIARDTEGVARVNATELRFETAVGQVRDAVAGSDEEYRSQSMSTQAPEAQPQPESRYEDRSRTETNPDAQPEVESDTGWNTTERDGRTDRDTDDTDRSMGDATGDTWLTTKVKSKLLADGDVSGFDISVETRDDVVHLSGEVENQAQHDIAVRLATETEGVARVDASALSITGR